MKKNGFRGTDYEGEKRNKRELFLISNFRCSLNVLFFLLGDSPASQFYVPTFRNALSVPSSKDRVPKRRHIKSRRRGITQKKEYNKRDLFLNFKCRPIVMLR